MSVPRLECKCVEVVAGNFGHHASALERASAAASVWDALWNCLTRRNLFAVASAERWNLVPLLRHHLRPIEHGSGQVDCLALDLSGVRAAPLTLTTWLAEQVVLACPSLRHLVTLYSGGQVVGSLRDEQLATLLVGLPELQGLEVESAVPLTDEGLERFFAEPSVTTRLTTLRLNRNAAISGQNLRRLVAACTQLRELSLTNFGCMEHITAELVHTIADAPLHATLTSLWLNDCSLIPDDALASVIDNCTNLEVLRIGLAMQIQGECFHHLNAHNAGAKLRHLDFNNCPLPRPTFMHIATYCTNLRTLGLANSPTPMSKAELTFLLQQCPRLKDFSATLSSSDALKCFERENQIRYLYLMVLSTEVGGEMAFADDDVASLALGCPALESLNLSPVSNNALWLLVAKLPNLRKLALQVSRPRFTGEPLPETAAAEPELPPVVCLELESLQLSCSNINDRHMHHFLSGLTPAVGVMAGGHGLRDIHLTSCPNVDDGVLEWISLFCAATLHKLVLYACPVGDRTAAVLARCYLLEFIGLKKCDQISPPAIAKLVRLRQSSLLHVFAPQGPLFRKETLQLAKDYPHIRFS